MPVLPQLDHLIGRAAEEILDSDDYFIWALRLEGNVFVANFDELTGRPLPSIVGTRLARVNLSADSTELVFARAGAKQMATPEDVGGLVVLNPNRYAIAIPGMEGWHFPQRRADDPAQSYRFEPAGGSESPEPRFA